MQRFFDSLGNIAAREAKKLFWVLGVDMAHMGRRYGDQLTAKADEGEMAGRGRARPVAHRTHERGRFARASGNWCSRTATI